MRVICILSLLIYVANGAACSKLLTEFDCQKVSTCKWIGPIDTGSCNCASEVKLDILFGIDASGSVGRDGFRIQRDFIDKLVSQGISNGSMIGFYLFGTVVTPMKTVQFWPDTQVLQDYVQSIVWTGGWTNTDGLIEAAITEFSGVWTEADGPQYTWVPGREQVLIILTDGNPCDASKCPRPICSVAGNLYASGIGRTIVISIGDGADETWMGCIADEWISVPSFSDNDFNSILGSLSNTLCPETKECKLTEVKAWKKDDTWTQPTVQNPVADYQPGDGRMTRFIEIYNAGVAFKLWDITLSGLVNMNEAGSWDSNTGGIADVEVQQGQYIVFYDASDTPASFSRGTYDMGPSVPSCHLCRETCPPNKAGCVACGLGTCGNKDLDSMDVCFCDNSIYIACENMDGGCPITSNSDQDTWGIDAEDGCASNACRFTNPGKTGWTQTITDVTGDLVVNEVEHNIQDWVTTRDRYSYELMDKGHDNTLGGNWGQSCSRFGTPGSDPFALCDPVCVDHADCGVGSLSCFPTGNCECDVGYYAVCTTSTSGTRSCLSCKKVPEVDECHIVWKKNHTTNVKYAEYSWSDNGLVPADNWVYHLSYFSNVDSEDPSYVKEKTTDGERFWTNNDYDAENDTYGGHVVTRIEECFLQPVNDVDTMICTKYDSVPVICDVTTSSPTAAPTDAPTDSPTASPTPEPTPSPTWACPRYYLTGGDPNICGSWSDFDRCYCHERSDTCCLKSGWLSDGSQGEADFSDIQDSERAHQQSESCKLDSEYDSITDRGTSDWDPTQVGGSPGYLLKAKRGNGYTHDFAVTITPTDYPCNMTICWELTFTNDATDCEYGSSNRRRMSADCADVSDLASAGLGIDNRQGCFDVAGQTDQTAAVFSFTVTQLVCQENNGQSNNSRRRLTAGCGLYDNIAIYGNLSLLNATSECQPDCGDGRIYPMRIPVWYNYADALVVPPSQEKELPAWLWWLIAALVVFLGLLAFLLYRYWWKNKKTGAALGNVQKDLDHAVTEMEDGFGHGMGKNDVGFNPLATGFNPNAAAGVGNPNAPPQHAGGGNEFIKPMNNPMKFQQQYGQQQGMARGLR